MKKKRKSRIIENKDNCFKFRKIEENGEKFMIINEKFYKTFKKIAGNKRKIEENCKELQEIWEIMLKKMNESQCFVKDTLGKSEKMNENRKSFRWNWSKSKERKIVIY